MTRTYSNRSNATRAAKAALAAAPAGAWFELVDQGNGAWTYVVRNPAPPRKVMAAKIDRDAAAVVVGPVEAMAVEAAPAREKRNGVVRPQPEGVSGRIWALADEIEPALGRPAKASDLRERTDAAGINYTTVGLALGYRRKFHRDA